MHNDIPHVHPLIKNARAIVNKTEIETAKQPPRSLREAKIVALSDMPAS